MIYTTYFANLKNVDKKGNCPIAICGKSPESYKGLEYKKLAPKWSFFKVWKENHDNNYYIEHFNAEVLNNLNQNQVMEDLRKLINYRYNLSISNVDKWWKYVSFNILLVCYEKPQDFCHRHLVAQWLSEADIEVKELSRKEC